MITTENLIQQKQKLEKQRQELVNQLIGIDTLSAFLDRQIKQSEADDAKGEDNGTTENDHTADAV